MAVGWSLDRTGSAVTVERWNGVSWSLQHAPSPSHPKDSRLLGVSCTSVRSCFAVGVSRSGNGKTGKTLAERWDGQRWTIQRTGNRTGRFNALNGVSCASGTSCMAVGLSSGHGAQSTLAERWNGHDWVIQRTPNLSFYPNGELFAISCTSSASCMAVGYGMDNESGVIYVPLAERWNGTIWTIERPPSHGGGGILEGVSCMSEDACTAVGHSDPGALAEFWNGSNWTIQHAHSPASDPDLLAVSCSSATSCIAVGDYSKAQNTTALAQAWTG
jgi:hypothetical protein